MGRGRYTVRAPGNNTIKCEWVWLGPFYLKLYLNQSCKSEGDRSNVFPPQGLNKRSSDTRNLQTEDIQNGRKVMTH
jgi:hypothetical protein